MLIILWVCGIDKILIRGEIMKKLLEEINRMKVLMNLTENVTKLSEEEEPKKKLFIPRRLSGENSRWDNWNKSQPIKDGVRINQYNIETGEKEGYWEERKNVDGMHFFRRVNYVNGKEDGYYELYSDDILTQTGNYVNGVTKPNSTETKDFKERKYTEWNKHQLNKWGELINQYNIETGEKEGFWKTMMGEGNYVNGKREGEWVHHTSKYGRLLSRGNYKNGKMEGEWVEYDKNGNHKRSPAIYSNNKLVRGTPVRTKF
jgi:antitoxin component YwqK of YwqJK toxin-antitoxin module